MLAAIANVRRGNRAASIVGMSFQVFGLPVSRGVAIGRAVLVASSRVDVAHYFIEESRVDAEITRLRDARDEVAGELGTLKRDLPADAPAELSALLDVHLMLLHDETLTGATKHWIQDRHYNAEWALSAQLEVLARQFDEMEDEYLRERKADLEQVVERLLRTMARGSSASFVPSPGGGPRDFGGEDPLVMVANDVAPADMLQFKRSVFTGFITDVGERPPTLRSWRAAWTFRPWLAPGRPAASSVRTTGSSSTAMPASSSSTPRPSCWRSTVSASARANSNARACRA